MENVHQVMKKDSVFFRSLELNPDKHDLEVCKHQYVRSIVRGMDKHGLEEGDEVTVMMLDGDIVTSIEKATCTGEAKKPKELSDAVPMEVEEVNDVIVDTFISDDNVIFL